MNQNNNEITTKNDLLSSEIIERVLNSIGLSRERTSTYFTRSFENGSLLRLRVSDHGLFMQFWYDKNREARMQGDDIPRLNIGQNLAITFSLTQSECEERNIHSPQKIANQTSVKTEQGNNAKPQFTIKHICYFSDMLEENDISLIIQSLQASINDGSIFNEPLKDNTKVCEWEDTSNLPPKRIQGEKLKNKNLNIKLPTGNVFDVVFCR